jgi:hypothetical protein
LFNRFSAVPFFVELAVLVATPGLAQLSPNAMLCFGLLPAQPDQLACIAVIDAGGDMTNLARAHCTRTRCSRSA